MTTENTTDNQPSATKLITNIYAVLAVSLIISFLPVAAAAAVAMAMFLGVWIAAYVIRGRAEPNSLTVDHMTFIIRTIWIAGLFALIGMTVATIYLLGVYDPAALFNCTGAVSADADMAAIEAAVKPCMDEFIAANMPYFLTGTAIAAGPVVIYLAYRLTKGLSRALKGHRIGDVKAWF